MLSLTTGSAVAEPSSLSLLFLSLAVFLGLILRRRFRKGLCSSQLESPVLNAPVTTLEVVRWYLVSLLDSTKPIG
jgi:hypothetical protein